MIARVKDRAIEAAFRQYVGDNLRLIGESTSRFGGGSYLKTPWADIIRTKPAETRSAEEIIEHMQKKMERLGDER